MKQALAMEVHGQKVEHSSIWVCRVYEPETKSYPGSHGRLWHVKPARIYTEVLRATVDNKRVDDNGELCVGVTWFRFGSEKPIGDEHSGRSQNIQPIEPIPVGPMERGEPMPGEWKL